jgi:hypothetical protein
MNMIFDGVAVLLLFFAFIAISSEGMWGSVLAFFNVLFAALVAMNFADKLAATIVKSASFLSGFADCLSLGGIFAVTLIVLRLATDYLAPGKLKIPPALEGIGKLVFGAGAAAILVGFLLVVLQTAPVHEKIFWGMYTPGADGTKPPFGMGLDNLALKVVETSLNGAFKGNTEFSSADWVAKHTKARPYKNAEAAATPTTEGGGAEGGTPAASGPTPNSPGIPGGTAGAAAGLAPTNP